MSFTRICLVLSYAAALIGSLWLAYQLRFDFAVPAETERTFLVVFAWVTFCVVIYYPAWLVFPTWHRLALGPGLVAVLATTTLLSQVAVALGRRGVRIPL